MTMVSSPAMAARILVVDDDPAMRRLLTVILESQDYQVQLASSVANALEAIAQQRPDVVCCDLMMPEVSGLDFLEQMRENPELAGIPVIVVSATGEEEMIHQARALGAFAHLAKPFSKTALLALIESALEATEE
ncbi:MAG: response regulator [Anaerolineae bacterium]